jgi:hypothetical protein
MTSPKVTEYIDPFEEEKVILQYFKDNWVANPKKLRKMALKLAQQPGQKQHLIDGVLFSILRTKDPIGYIQECFNQHDDYTAIFQDFIAAGHHGVIVVNRLIYSVTLSTRKNWLKFEDRWNIDEEIEIMEQSARNWMQQHDKEKFVGKVMLFPVFGFSGHFRRIQWPE